MHELSLLSRVPPFRGLGEAELERVGAMLRRRRYKRGETIFLRGDPGANLYIVESGRVKLGLTSEYQGREVTVAFYGPGEMFGELALLDDEARSANAVAVEPTQLLLLGRDDFLSLLRSLPEMAIDLLIDMSQRLRRDIEVIGYAAFLDVPARVAGAILRLATPQPDGSLCTPAITQTELAEFALTTRETLNKILGEYEDRGIISRDAGRVRVLNKEALARRSAP